MIRADNLIGALKGEGVTFWTGVPDSYLAPFCHELVLAQEPNVIAANEGSAIGLAAGHYLASNELALVYLQNSGLGNAINPILSLASPEVFGIPMILLVGWRGKPGTKDEPQHVHQGKITPELLNSCGIRYVEWEPGCAEWQTELHELTKHAILARTPVALLVSKGTIGSSDPMKTPLPQPTFTRRDALEVALDGLKGYDFIATTGYTSRVLMELRERRSEDPCRDFLVVGSMGHALSIATGIAITRPDRSICCLDGDGATLMHLGGLATVAATGCANLIHIVINNRSHDSVGGFPTCHPTLGLEGVARSLGYRKTFVARERRELNSIIAELGMLEGPIFIEVVVEVEPSITLSRPRFTPKENLETFQARLRRVVAENASA